MNSFNSWRTVSDFKIRDQIIHSIIVKGLSQRQEGKPISEGRDPPPPDADGLKKQMGCREKYKSRSLGARGKGIDRSGF